MVPHNALIDDYDIYNTIKRIWKALALRTITLYGGLKPYNLLRQALDTVINDAFKK